MISTDMMNGIIELIKLYLRPQARPQNLVLLLIFDLQIEWLRGFSFSYIHI